MGLPLSWCRVLQVIWAGRGVEGSDPASPRPRPREAARGHPLWLSFPTPSPRPRTPAAPSARPLGRIWELRCGCPGGARRLAGPRAALRRPQSRRFSAGAVPKARLPHPGSPARGQSDCEAGEALPQRAAGSGWAIGAGPGSAPGGGRGRGRPEVSRKP